MRATFLLLVACSAPEHARVDAATCCALLPDDHAVIACACEHGGLEDSCAGMPDATSCVLGYRCGMTFVVDGVCPVDAGVRS